MLAIVLVALALFWDAPLEQLANPLLTPNPAKAPWYFLGLQELLHYFPPLVAGVLLPTLVVLGLVVIPYFDVNIEGEPLWAHRSRRRFQVYVGVFVSVFVLLALYDAWTVLIPTVLVGVLGLIPYFNPTGDSRFQKFLGSRPAAVVGDDLVHRRRPDAHGGRDFFQGPGMVLGLALEMKCLLKTWEKSQNACV